MYTSKRKLPDIICIGPTCSGTTAIFTYFIKYATNLNHPYECKEPNYLWLRKYPEFINKLKNHSSIISLDKYSFNSTQNNLTIDFSPNYFYFADDVIDSIKELYVDQPLPKLFTILRDPLNRAKSQYRSTRFDICSEELNFKSALSFDSKFNFTSNPLRELKNNKGLEYELDYLRYSNYISVIDKFKDAFEDNFKIFIFEELFSDIERGLYDLANFSELKITLPSKFNSNPIGVKGAPRSKFLQKILVSKDNSFKRFLRKTLVGDFLKFVKDYILYNKFFIKKSSFDSSIEERTEVFFKDIKNGVEIRLGKKLDSWCVFSPRS